MVTAAAMTTTATVGWQGQATVVGTRSVVPCDLQPTCASCG